MQEGAVAAQIAVDGYAVGSFLAYLLLLLAIGVYSSRFSSEGISEFFVGGRRMNRLVVALSAVVSGRSAWLLLGVTGMAYAMGASALWSVSGYTAAELILFLTYAKRLRLFSERYDCITLPDFFAARFGDRDGRLRLTLVMVILTFMVVYVAAQFVGGGKAMAASFGVTQWTGVLLTAAIVLGYTMVGGFLAVSLTDTLQALFMMVGLVILPIVAISVGGGWIRGHRPGVSGQPPHSGPIHVHQGPQPAQMGRVGWNKLERGHGGRRRAGRNGRSRLLPGGGSAPGG